MKHVKVYVPLPASVSTTENVIPAAALMTRCLSPSSKGPSIARKVGIWGETGCPHYTQAVNQKPEAKSTTHLTQVICARRPYLAVTGHQQRMTTPTRCMHKHNTFFCAQVGRKHASRSIFRYRVLPGNAKGRKCIPAKHPRSTIDVQANEVTAAT
jgi:hypothetical protein